MPARRRGQRREAMKRGYLKLWRRFQTNELWMEPRVFSKAEAWIDILFEVRYHEKPVKVQFGYKTIICHRGESLNSIETWAYRWGWSKSKVVRFFGMLKNRNAIETHSETQTTRLIVCNYNAYNNLRNGNGTQAVRKPERTRNARGTHSETEEEGKESNNVNKGKTTGATPPKVGEKEILWKPTEEDFEKLWSKYPRKKGKDRARVHFFAQVKTPTDLENINIALDNYLAEIIRMGIKEEHIKHGSRWFNHYWEDDVTYKPQKLEDKHEDAWGQKAWDAKLAKEKESLQNLR